MSLIALRPFTREQHARIDGTRSRWVFLILLLIAFPLQTLAAEADWPADANGAMTGWISWVILFFLTSWITWVVFRDAFTSNNEIFRRARRNQMRIFGGRNAGRLAGVGGVAGGGGGGFSGVGGGGGGFSGGGGSFGGGGASGSW